MSKLYLIKDNMFNIGLSLIAVAAVFVTLFLSTELLESLSFFVPFAGGFLVSGFVSLFVGFLFTMIFCYTMPEEPETENGKSHKIRAVLVAVIVLYLILLAYLVSGEMEWTIRAAMIDNIGGFPIEPSYALYTDFEITSTELFQTTLIIFGILVLPVGLAELGVLDDPKRGKDETDDQAFEGEEAAFDQLMDYLKRRFGSMPRLQKVKKVKNVRSYASYLAAVFIAVGSCCIVLPRFLLIDGPVLLYPGTNQEYVKDYLGAARGQYLILGIVLIVVAIVLLRRFRKNIN